MNILILGSGGREHSLAWAVQQNPKCDKLIVAPGNAGMDAIAECANIDPCDRNAVVNLCEAEAVDLVIIGPEAPLAAGVADRLREAGIAVFGPSAAAAQLEASKRFTKEICDAAGVPTARYAAFTDPLAAKDYIRREGAPIVVKADGLAAGKGVIVAMDEPTALDAIDTMFSGAFGAAGEEVVIEECMMGEEASYFVICDGTQALPIGTAQDHKRVGDGDVGPNTGGMGAYSPAPVLTDAIQTQVMDQIVRPTLVEMDRRGTPFQGVLYVGLMIENGQARLVEYNVRFGDPECQVLMLRLGAQVLDTLQAAAEGRLDDAQINWADDHAMTVVMAAKGYPGSYQKGTEIRGLDRISSHSKAQVFHAGTGRADGIFTAQGGRVLNITGRGATLEDAKAQCDEILAQIDWPDGFFRRDIGHRALNS